MLKNGKKISYKSIEIFLAGIIPLFFQMQLYFKMPSILMYIPYILICISLIFRFNISSYRMSTKTLSISFILITVYLALPFIFFTIIYNDFKQNLLYSFLYFILIISLKIVSDGINIREYYKLIKITLFNNSIILIFALLTNISEVNSNSIKGVFTGSRASRAMYELGHPNFAAMFIVTEIILMYILWYKEKKIKFFAISFGFVIFLLSTGSRTACYSLVIFLIVEILMNIYNNKKLNKNLKNIFLMIICIFIVLIFLKNNTFETLLKDSSGRDESIIYNINVLINNGKVLIGYGPVQISTLCINIPEIKISDNWYITQLIRYGLIGMLMVMSCIIIIFKKIIKYINGDNSYIISLMIMLLFYSSAENVLLVPGVILSWICWIIFYCNIEIYSKN